MPLCGRCEMKQSADVLDTWFSSALWPFAGLTPSDRKKFYPSDVLVTARDIINLWAARMIFRMRIPRPGTVRQSPHPRHDSDERRQKNVQILGHRR